MDEWINDEINSGSGGFSDQMEISDVFTPPRKPRPLLILRKTRSARLRACHATNDDHASIPSLSVTLISRTLPLVSSLLLPTRNSAFVRSSGNRRRRRFSFACFRFANQRKCTSRLCLLVESVHLSLVLSSVGGRTTHAQPLN